MGRFPSRPLRATASSGALTVLAVLLACILGSAGGVGRADAARTPLRQVDWLAVLANDPSIGIDPDAYPLPAGPAPFVSVPAPGGPDGALSGYALIDAITYGDLDGDAAEEAILPIFSGGTAGLLGFLLYREADPAPKLVLVRTGYKLGVAIEGGRIRISQPNYTDYDPNCCPSSTTHTLNALEGDRLVPLTSEVEPHDVQEHTVAAFYRALADRHYEEAYAFYSPAFQASNPFDAWKAGYANTRRIEVETAPGPTPAEVLIVLTATDVQPGGGTVTRRFRGSWTLVWSPEQKRWLLDRASVGPA